MHTWDSSRAKAWHRYSRCWFINQHSPIYSSLGNRGCSKEHGGAGGRVVLEYLMLQFRVYDQQQTTWNSLKTEKFDGGLLLNC